jgi:hypothetical protein
MDIAHCVAHSDRNKGNAYAFADKFVVDLLGKVKTGGVIIVEPIFKREQLVSRLSKDLTALNLDISAEEVARNYDLIEACLRDILDDTKILLTNSKVKSATLRVGDFGEGEILGIVIEFKDIKPGVLKLPPGTNLAFPVFSQL